MKDTTIVVLVISVCATVLAGMGIIDGAQWAMVAGGGVLAKGAQGTADRWNGRRRKPDA